MLKIERENLLKESSVNCAKNTKKDTQYWLPIYRVSSKSKYLVFFIFISLFLIFTSSKTMAAVGPKLKKWTWMMDDIVVRGVVLQFHSEEGPNSDGFDLRPDENYKHLLTLGNHLNFNGGLHVEAYSQSPVAFTDPNVINHVRPFPLPDKGVQPFQVFDPKIGKLRDLQVGDHIEINGRWIIENQHEDSCWTRMVLGPGSVVLKVGCVWSELHPFMWNKIRLVIPQNPDGKEVETLSLAAPIYEETYQRGGLLFWLVGRVFVAEDGSNYNNRVAANAYIKAPPLPTGFTPHRSLINYSEVILQNGTGLDISKIRNIEVVDDGIKVTASVQAPIKEFVDGVGIADINDPANNQSVFQARYTVYWQPRLFVVGSASTTEPIKTIQLAPQMVGTSTRFSIFLRNNGPDALQIKQAEVYENEGLAFSIDSPNGMNIPAWSTVELKGTFSPPRFLGNYFPVSPPYTVTARIHIKSTDPAHESIEIAIQGKGVGAPFSSKVKVVPSKIDFGQVEIGNGVEKAFSIYNDSDNRIAIEKISIISEIPAQQFKIYTRVPGIIVSPNETGQVLVYYAPTTIGVATAQAKIPIVSSSISHPDSTELAITVSGEGVHTVRPKFNFDWWRERGKIFQIGKK